MEFKNLSLPELQPAIDKAKIMGYQVDYLNKTLSVSISKGFFEDDVFVVKWSTSYTISGPAGSEFDAIMNAQAADKSAVELIEEGIWNWLIAKNALSLET